MSVIELIIFLYSLYYSLCSIQRIYKMSIFILPGFTCEREAFLKSNLWINCFDVNVLIPVL